MWNQPCPTCGGQEAQAVAFTWWGGMMGPKMLNHVKCPNCGTQYNGKTGGSNDVAIVIYLVVGCVVGLVLGVALFAMRLGGRF